MPEAIRRQDEATNPKRGQRSGRKAQVPSAQEGLLESMAALACFGVK